MKKPPRMVWLPAEHRFLGDEGLQMSYLVLGEKYAQAVKLGSNALPVLFTLADADQIPDLLASLEQSSVFEQWAFGDACRARQLSRLAQFC